MPFTLIQGTYHLVNRTPGGNPTGFKPDGDSIHFKPAVPALLDRLKVIVQPVELTKIGSLQLRLEGIDSLELHYGQPPRSQPRPLADQARDLLTGLLGMNPVPYTPPNNTQVKPPVPHDAAPGFILSRTLEFHGRPVSFAFAGPPPTADGATVDLDVPLLKKSLNYQILKAGHAYPLFYDGLFVDLRNTLAACVRQARNAKRGLWKLDRNAAGIVVTTLDALELNAVVFPKLFRRLVEFLDAPGARFDHFAAWLESKSDRLLDLPNLNFTGFDNVVRVESNTVKLTRRPEELVFLSAG